MAISTPWIGILIVLFPAPARRGQKQPWGKSSVELVHSHELEAEGPHPRRSRTGRSRTRRRRPRSLRQRSPLRSCTGSCQQKRLHCQQKRLMNRSGRSPRRWRKGCSRTRPCPPHTSARPSLRASRRKMRGGGQHGWHQQPGGATISNSIALIHSDCVPLQQLLAQARFLSLWRTLSVRILTYANVGAAGFSGHSRH